METDVKDIIQKSTHLSEYDKDIFIAVFEKLKLKQERLFDGISEKVKNELFKVSCMDKNWNTTTALIDKKELQDAQKNGFEEIIKINTFKENILFEDLDNDKTAGQRENIYTAGVAFLHCRYSEITDIIKNRYRAHVTTKDEDYYVDYFFKKYYGFYEREKLLEETAHQYSIGCPVLFSPMSRRAFIVVLDFGNYNISKSDNLKIDFQLDINGLSGMVDTEKTLIWNINIADENEIPRPRENTKKTVTALFDNTYQIYEFYTDGNEYIHIKSDIADIKRYENSVYVNLNENQDIENIRYCKIKINDYTRAYEENRKNIFQNYFKQNSIYKERIRTEADIDYVIKSFENENIQYSGLKRIPDNNKLTRTYEKRDLYHYPKNTRLRNSSHCYLEFVENNYMYFEDYISYILAYMNYHYPEFYWTGVV